MLKPSPAQADVLLGSALEMYTRRELASALGVDVRTLVSWSLGDLIPEPHVARALESLLTPGAVLRHENPKFTFVDLFAGIGGIRQGFESHGGECVFTAEWNAFSKRTYTVNFGAEHKFIDDIVGQHGEVPEHDVLLAGFPCQPFSIAGVSKKNSLGRPHGFEDPTQGTLFFEIKEIIKATRPSAFILENVKNLASHDKGNTFRVIRSVLEDELGYEFHARVIDGGHFTPQHRERIVIIGFARETAFSWDELHLPPKTDHRMEHVLHKIDGSEPFLAHDSDKYFNFSENAVQGKYTLTENLWRYLQDYAKKHRAAGNGFGFGLVDASSRSRTLSARYYKDGSEILVSQAGNRPRRLTPRECARLMGFDDSFVIPVSDTQAYRQFGNSVVAPVFKEVARVVTPHLLTIKDSAATSRLGSSAVA